MELIRWEKQDNRLYVETTNGRIRLAPVSAKAVHVVYTLEPEFCDKPSLMIAPRAHEPEPVEWRVEETEAAVELIMAELTVRIAKQTAAFTYLDKTGAVLTREPKRGGKTLDPIEVEVNVYDDAAEVTTGMSVDGVRAEASRVRDVVKRRAYHTKLEFEWEQGEALYGLGSHEEGIMNLRGTSQYLYQQNMKAVVPALVSTKGYGVLFDSYSLMTFHDDVYGSYVWSDVDDELDYYFVYGPELDDVVAGFRALTGRVPLLPKWAFGYAQSKERYKSQEELVAVVREYRDRGIPLDLIILDWCSWTGNLWGQKSLDPERFPDPAGMMNDIHGLGAKLMVSIWPIMTNDGSNHLEMKRHGAMLGNRSTYNAFSAEARALYWKQANEGLFAHGIDAWWCDCTEPFEADWTGAVKPEPEDRLRINTGRSKKYIDPEYINAYSLQHSKGIYEGQRSVTEAKRVVNLTRSAYAGQQRYGTITWSGDIAANWETLRKQIPAGLHFCLTGSPYWTMDIGAFFVARKEQWFWCGEYDAGCDDPGYRELYVRWFQYGAFLPMFRSHGTDTPREVWRFGEPGSVHYDTLVAFIRLRYRLMPYLYALAGWVTHDDYTMLRALAFDFRDDPATYGIDDQFMLGPAFLVNPVCEPMYVREGEDISATSRKTRAVYLPAGADWYDFWTGVKLAGGQTVEADAPLDKLPLYVRAGAIVPMGPVVQHTGEQSDAPLELWVCTGADGWFVLYEDEGDGYAYERGAYATTEIRWHDLERRLTIGERNGAYPGMAERRAFRIRLVTDGTGFDAEAQMPDARTIVCDGAATVVKW